MARSNKTQTIEDTPVPSAPKPKQLKKMDLLAALPADPIERAEVKDLLAGFEFIDSYVEYLINHFIALGRILATEGSTMIQLAPKKVTGGGIRELFIVGKDEQGKPTLYKVFPEGVMTKEDIEQHRNLGYRITPGAAKKAATSQAFKDYKANIALINGLEVSEAPSTDDREVATEEV